MNEEIVIDGKVYVLKESIKTVIKPKTFKGMIYAIVRTYSAGVFAGYINPKDTGKEGKIFCFRRLWYWDGAASLSQLSRDGVSKPENCKFSVVCDEISLTEIIERLPVTEKARLNIVEVPEWKK